MAFEGEKRHKRLEKDGPARKETEDPLIIVARYGNVTEAHLALTKLESEGVEAYLADEHMVSLDPGIYLAFGGVKLRTKRSEAGKAARILGIKN